MTSIEYVFEQLEEQGLVFLTTKTNELSISISASDYLDIKRLAKEMHKQEIIDAQSYAISNADMTNNKGYFDCDKYYQETFVSKGSDEVELPQQEISDEEIEEEIRKRYMHPTMDYAFRDACKWYREQLKQL